MSDGRGTLMSVRDPEPDLQVAARPQSFFVVDAHAGGLELERGPAREPFLADAEERTGFWTHYVCHLVRVIFLFSHGLLVVTVSSALENANEVSWPMCFMAAWVGDPVCMVLLVYSWFASCPYIKRCHREERIRIGAYPSFLTEVLPEIVLSIFGLIFMILILIAECLLCGYLTSLQAGEPKHAKSSAVFLCIVSTLSMCHGTLLTHNSAVYLGVGASVLFSLIFFLWNSAEGPEEHAIVLVPPALAALGIAIAATVRVCGHWRVFSGEEALVRVVEILCLLLLLYALVSVHNGVQASDFHQASNSGMMAGGILSAIALLRARVYWWEAQKGTLLERVIEELAVPGEGIFDEDEMPFNDHEFNLAAEALSGDLAL